MIASNIKRIEQLEKLIINCIRTCLATTFYPEKYSVRINYNGREWKIRSVKAPTCFDTYQGHDYPLTDLLEDPTPIQLYEDWGPDMVKVHKLAEYYVDCYGYEMGLSEYR